MPRLLLLLGLLPLLGALLARHLCSERFLRKLRSQEMTLTGEELAQRLLEICGINHSPKWSERKIPTWKVSTLTFNKSLGSSKNLVLLSDVGLGVGLKLLSKKEKTLVEWHQRAVKFSNAFPIFLVLVLVFALLVGSLLRWALPLACFGVGLSVGAGFFAVFIELQAVAMMTRALAKRTVFRREDEREAFVQAMKARAWRRCVPGVFERFFP